MLRKHTICLLRLTRPSSSFSSRPSPPRLPESLQSEFERLQRSAAVSSAFQPSASSSRTEDASASSSGTGDASASSSRTEDASTGSASAPAPASASQEAVSQNQGLFRGAPPEFDGDTNPKTGEVGGPKNEPLRWGGEGDWSYNGRVTDF